MNKGEYLESWQIVIKRGKDSSVWGKYFKVLYFLKLEVKRI